MGLVLFECPVCEKIFKNRRSIMYHLRKHHPNIKMRDVKRISAKTYEYLETESEDSN